MLDETALRRVGEFLLVECVYAWGWSKKNTGTVEIVRPLRTKLVELWDFDGERRGGIGQVQDPEHPCDGYWVVFSTRHAGVWNFDDRFGY